MEEYSFIAMPLAQDPLDAQSHASASVTLATVKFVVTFTHLLIRTSESKGYQQHYDSSMVF
jgi:hypothetical protein